MVNFQPATLSYVAVVYGRIIRRLRLLLGSDQTKMRMEVLIHRFWLFQISILCPEKYK